MDKNYVETLSPRNKFDCLGWYPENNSTLQRTKEKELKVARILRFITNHVKIVSCV